MANKLFKKFWKKKTSSTVQNLVPLQVMDSRMTTENSKLLTFEIPSTHIDDFNWEAGQYITLHIPHEGTILQRDYSLCYPKEGNKASICVKKTMNGTISKKLVEEEWIHKEIEASIPRGKFTLPIKPNEKRSIIGFAAGSGITPIYCMIQNILKNEKDSQFHLFYGNKTPESTIFLNEIKELAQTYSDRFFPHFIFSQHSNENRLWEGRIDISKLDLWINQILDWDETDEVVICGPNEMSVDIRNACIERGLHPSQVHMELFTPLSPSQNVNEDKDFSAVSLKVTYDGTSETLVWEDFSVSMLDTILNSGMEVPYSCKGGVCGTCLCQKTGKAEMGEQLALVDSEVEEGKFLPCVSYRAEGEVQLDFDSV